MFYIQLLLLSAISVVLSTNDTCLFLVLIDGVRKDYIDEEERPGFKELRENGVEAEYLRPIFPSNSYPNWYTIATDCMEGSFVKNTVDDNIGEQNNVLDKLINTDQTLEDWLEESSMLSKYAESHGFVNNYIYDRERNDFFTGGPPADESVASYWWNQTEPVWVTAEKNGIRTGMYWWDGCQVNIDGVRPTECVRYKSYYWWSDVNKDTAEQASRVLKRIKKNELCFAMLYYEPVDGYGHLGGPYSEKRKESLRAIDKILYHLQAQIKELDLEEKLNLVVVSDHGMTAISRHKTKVIKIANAVNDEDIEMMLDTHYFSMLWPVKGMEEKVYNDLKNKNTEGLQVYRKREVPEKYHFRNNKLIAPIILMADKTHTIAPYPKKNKMKPFYPLGHVTLFLSPGVHGFDPYSKESTEMFTIFYARGPSFKKNYTCPPMEMTDVYNVLCYSLGIEPLQNNGSWHTIKDFLI